MSSIITEHKYEAARWDGSEGWWGMETLTTADVVTEHNATIITLQGAHDEECERLRHQLADASETIREQSARINELEAQVPKVVRPVEGSCPLCGEYNHIFGANKLYCGACGAKLDWEG